MNPHPLPWYIAGPLIGLMVPLLLILREKQLGLSSSYRYIGSLILPKNSYYSYNRQSDLWQLQFGLGILLSALVLFQFNLVDQDPINADVTADYLKQFPLIYSPSNWLFFLVGGVFIGFGARYAGGCTAGHCIMGNSLLSPASLITTIMFFIGGLAVTHFVLPYLN